MRFVLAADNSNQLTSSEIVVSKIKHSIGKSKKGVCIHVGMNGMNLERDRFNPSRPCSSLILSTSVNCGDYSCLTYHPFFYTREVFPPSLLL